MAVQHMGKMSSSLLRLPSHKVQRAYDTPRGRWLFGMPLGLVALVSISVAPNPGKQPLDNNVALVLERLHTITTSTKTGRSLQLHAKLREICTSAEGTGVADKMMLKYRANTAKFGRQSSEDWQELLTTAHATCAPTLLRVTAAHNHRKGAGLAGSLRVSAPDLTDWSKACPQLEPRATQGAGKSFWRRGRDNDEVGLYITSAAYINSNGLSTSGRPRNRGVEAELRAMLQQAVRDHTWTISHSTVDQKGSEVTLRAPR